jgi:hypothetical protein
MITFTGGRSGACAGALHRPGVLGRPGQRLGARLALPAGLHGGPVITRSVTLYAFFGYCLLVTAAILAVRVLVLVFRPDTS